MNYSTGVPAVDDIILAAADRAVMLHGIQEQREKIETLEDEIEAGENRAAWLAKGSAELPEAEDDELTTIESEVRRAGNDVAQALERIAELEGQHDESLDRSAEQAERLPAAQRAKVAQFARELARGR